MGLRMIYKSTKESGYTLLELLLYFAVASTIFLVIVVFASQVLQARAKNQAIALVEQEGIQAMQVMTQTIRNSDAVLAPIEGTSANDLTLNRYDPTQDPTTLSLVDSAIELQESSDPEIALTTSQVEASNLLFSNFSQADTPGTIRIVFTLEYANSSDLPSFNYEKTFHGEATLRFP